MKKLASLFLLAVALVAPASYARGKKAAPTAPGTYKEWGPDIDRLEVVKTFHFGDYTQVVVEPFDTDSVQLPDKDDNSYDAARKVVSSATEGFVQGLRGSIEPKVSLSEKSGKSEGTLLVRGKVLEMDPGSKAARYFAGFGAGAARTKIEGEIVDGHTGEVLARFTQERRSGVGMMGGDYQELMQRNLNAIGEDVAAILKTF